MNHKNLISLGKDAKEIVLSIGRTGKDSTGLLNSKNKAFYIKDILDYIKNDYEPSEDNLKVFKKVVLNMSFAADNTVENQKYFLQILSKHKDFSSELCSSLDEKILAKDSGNIHDLNIAMFEKAIHEKQYVSILQNIINENINSDDLHNVVYNEVVNYGKDCPVNKQMVRIYLSHKNLNEHRMNDIIKLWSHEAVDLRRFGGLTLEEQNKEVLNYIQIEYLQRRSSKKDAMPAIERSYIISSMHEYSKIDVDADIAASAMSEMSKLYKARPELKDAVLQTLSNMSMHPKYHEFANDLLQENADSPELINVFLDEIRSNPKKIMADSVAILPLLAEKYPQYSDEYIAIAAKAVRNSNSDYQINQIFCESSSYFDEKGNNVFADIFNKNHKYLAHVALNDSKMTPYDAINFAEQILDRINESIEAAHDEEDDDDNNIISYEDEKVYEGLSDYLKIIEESKIINKDEEAFSKFFAIVKSTELLDLCSDRVSGEYRKAFNRNVKKIKPSTFIEDLLISSMDISSQIDKEEKGITYKLDDKIFDFVEIYTKKVKLTTEQKHNVLLTLNEFKNQSEAADAKKYEKLINIIKMKNFDTQKDLGRSE